MATDQILLTRWIRGQDAGAFDELASRHAATVYSTCRRILRDASAAEDVTQECFLKLAFRCEDPPRSLTAWLHRVATNLALKRIRSDVRRKARERRWAESRNTHGEDLDWPRLCASVDAAIAELPEEQRHALIRHFIERQSHAAIARESGVSKSTVTYRIHGGIRSVREILRRRGVLVTGPVLLSLLSQELPATEIPQSVLVNLAKVAIAGRRITASSRLSVPMGLSFTSKKVVAALVLAVLLATGIVGVMWKVGEEQVNTGTDSVTTLTESPKIELSRDTMELNGVSSRGAGNDGRGVSDKRDAASRPLCSIHGTLHFSGLFDPRRLNIEVRGPVDTAAANEGAEVPVKLDAQRMTFLCDGMSTGRFRVAGSYDGRAFEINVHLSRDGENRTVLIDLDDVSEMKITGRAFVGSLERPLCDAVLVVKFIAEFDKSQGESSVKTDANGEFVVSSKVLRTGTTVRFYRDLELPFVEWEYRADDEELWPYVEVIFEEALPRLGVLVTPSGSPVPHAYLWFTDETNNRVPVDFGRRCDSRGEFSADSILAGSYEFSVYSAFGRTSYFTGKVQVRDSPERVVLVAEVSNPLVTIVSRLGSPVPAYLVRLKLPDGSEVWRDHDQTYTSEEHPGTSCFMGLPRSGRVQIEVLSSLGGWGRTVVDLQDLLEDPFVRIALNGSRRIEVMVVDENAVPVVGVSVEVPDFSRQYDHMTQRERETDARSVIGEQGAHRDPFLDCTKVAGKELGTLRLTVHPGDGARVRFFSPTVGEATVSTDDLLRSRRVVLRE